MGFVSCDRFCLVCCIEREITVKKETSLSEMHDQPDGVRITEGLKT